MKNKFKLIYLTVTMLALALSLSVSTYAWFSTNSVTDTQLATGKSGTDTVELQLSSTGPDNFNGSSQAAIAQVNKSKSTGLYPVSTVDLKNYLYNPSTVENNATYFVPVENERYIYHGRIFVKAATQGHLQGGKIALYLDEDDSNGGKMISKAEGHILNAARMGLVINGQQPLILRFTDDKNPEEWHIDNTVIDGELLTSGFVLALDGDSKVKAYKDPSELLNNYVIPANGIGNSNVKPLTYLNLDQVYTIDVYFYLEGCDPDCTEITEFDNLDFHLGFYGVLTEEVTG